jgi:hypothetical protein
MVALYFFSFAWSGHSLLFFILRVPYNFSRISKEEALWRISIDLQMNWGRQKSSMFMNPL